VKPFRNPKTVSDNRDFKYVKFSYNIRRKLAYKTPYVTNNENVNIYIYSAEYADGTDVSIFSP